MQIKKIQPINFLYFRTEATIPQLIEFIPVSQVLYREAVRIGLTICGAVHWHYIGMKDMVSPFTLDVAIPVREIKSDYDGIYQFKRTESFKAVSAFHDGPYETIPNTYDLIFKYLGENKLTPTGNNREIYINVDFDHPDANYTEIQFGIQ